MKKQLTIIAFAAFALSAWAQEENQFTVDAQLRTRVEYNNGASTPRAEGESPATYINERARLSMGYLRNNFEMKASIQHTGLWGDEDVKTPNGKVALNEAWAKLKFGKGYFAQIGRQQLSYDDERILGTLEWHVAGNWHDALKLGYENGTNKLHLIMAWNQNANNVKDAYYTGPMDYRDMQTLWYHYQAPKTPLGVSFIFMNLGRKDAVNGNGKANYMQTLGTDLTFKPAEFDIHGALYYQMGKDATGIKHSAWMASAKVGYKLNPIWGVKAGYDYRSGNDGSDKIKAFDQLYGSHHLFNGAMDYFLQKVPLGLHDIQAGITCKASSKTNMQLNYHYFSAAQKAINGKKSLGHEIDLQLTSKLMKDVTLMAGYSTMFGTETMDIVKGGNHTSWQDWAWVQLNINPRLFTKVRYKKYPHPQSPLAQ